MVFVAARKKDGNYLVQPTVQIRIRGSYSLKTRNTFFYGAAIIYCILEFLLTENAYTIKILNQLPMALYYVYTPLFIRILP